MNQPRYALVDQGDQWAAVRDDTVLLLTWDRNQDPTTGHPSILAQMTPTVEARLGYKVTWVQHGTDYRPAPA